jgi:hypothetical protein
MKAIVNKIGMHRTLAVILTVVLLLFSLVVFLSQTFNKSQLKSAKIAEVLQIQDEQGLIYQNFLVTINEGNQIQVRIPINLPEVRGLQVGDRIYLEEFTGGEYGTEYRFASVDKSLEFLTILGLFIIVIFIVVGVNPSYSMYPAMAFLILILSGVYTINTEVRYIFLSTLGFMMIISIIHTLWYYKDLVLGLIVSMIVGFSLFFGVLLHTLLINFTHSSELIRFWDLFGQQSLVYEYEQARILVTAIFIFGLILSLTVNIISSSEKYISNHKNLSSFKMTKYGVESVQNKMAQMLNMIFFLALGLNFIGLISEDFTPYKFIWDNSFFLGVVIDGIVAAISLIVAGYLLALFISLYYKKMAKTSDVKPIEY